MTPGKEGFGRVLPASVEHAQWLCRMYGWAACCYPVRNIASPLYSLVWAGKGERGSRGRVETEDQTFEFSGNQGSQTMNHTVNTEPKVWMNRALNN